MLLLACPWCGERAQTEFSYGGDATVTRPTDPLTVSSKDWLEYIYIRNNPRGPLVEWWHHGSGCRRWFKVKRNTWTHEVLASGKPRDDLESIDK